MQVLYFDQLQILLFHKKKDNKFCQNQLQHPGQTGGTCLCVENWKSSCSVFLVNWRVEYRLINICANISWIIDDC